MIHWQNMLSPESPGGQLGHASGTPPPPSVTKLSTAAAGSGTRTPQFTLAGVLANDTTRIAGAFGAAFVKTSDPALPVSRLPVPTSFGTPLAPARPKPRSTHAPIPNAYAAPAWLALLSLPLPFTPVALLLSPCAPATTVSPEIAIASPNKSPDPVFEALRYACCVHVVPLRANT